MGLGSLEQFSHHLDQICKPLSSLPQRRLDSHWQFSQSKLISSNANYQAISADRRQQPSQPSRCGIRLLAHCRRQPTRPSRRSIKLLVFRCLPSWPCPHTLVRRRRFLRVTAAGCPHARMFVYCHQSRRPRARSAAQSCAAVGHRGHMPAHSCPAAGHRISRGPLSRPFIMTLSCRS